VFTQGANADAAKEAGADLVGMEDLAEQIKKGEMNFDVVIASPDAMRVVGQLGQVLGPRAPRTFWSDLRGSIPKFTATSTLSTNLAVANCFNNAIASLISYALVESTPALIAFIFLVNLAIVLFLHH